MKKAIIIYNSKTGNTKHFAGEISKYLKSLNVPNESISILDYQKELIDESDIVFLGCWTSGWMVMFQHPQKIWKEFAKQLPDLSGKKVVLFTTYKISTGSMFSNMKKNLKLDKLAKIPLIKSRSTILTNSDKSLLQSFL